MGIFSRILDKLRGHGSTGGGQGTAGQATAGQASAGQQQQFQPGSTASGQPLRNVDVDAVLTQMASKKGGGGNYRESIVDLLKLLDLDSDLNARKELAQELNVHAGEHGSAEQNIALHKAVMRKLAENGGKVPDSMRH
jgi:uncharacterized protein DUF3597